MAADATQHKENAALAHRAIEEVINEWDAAVDELYADEFILTMPRWGADIRGRTAYKEYVVSGSETFPDYEETIEEVIVDGETVVLRNTACAIHAGELRVPGRRLLAPTGRSYEVPIVRILTIEDGKIKAEWRLADTMGIAE